MQRKGVDGMNWKVFKSDDPETWPKINCLFLICWTRGKRYKFYNAVWDNEVKCFTHDLRKIIFEVGDIFYVNISYIPYIQKELHPVKCSINDWGCEFNDDGYCLNDEKCGHQKAVTEYMLGAKVICKEF